MTRTRNRINRSLAARLSALGIALLGCGLAAATRGPVIADDVPPWLRQLASASQPSQDKRIFRQWCCCENRSSELKKTARQPPSNDRRYGYCPKKAARKRSASVHYTTDTGKVRDMRACDRNWAALSKNLAKKRLIWRPLPTMCSTMFASRSSPRATRPNLGRGLRI